MYCDCFVFTLCKPNFSAVTKKYGLFLSHFYLPLCWLSLHGATAHMVSVHDASWHAEKLDLCCLFLSSCVCSAVKNHWPSKGFWHMISCHASIFPLRWRRSPKAEFFFFFLLESEVLIKNGTGVMLQCSRTCRTIQRYLDDLRVGQFVLGWRVKCSSCFLMSSFPGDVVKILELKRNVPRIETWMLKNDEEKEMYYLLFENIIILHIR